MVGIEQYSRRLYVADCPCQERERPHSRKLCSLIVFQRDRGTKCCLAFLDEPIEKGSPFRCVIHFAAHDYGASCIQSPDRRRVRSLTTILLAIKTRPEKYRISPCITRGLQRRLWSMAMKASSSVGDMLFGQF